MILDRDEARRTINSVNFRQRPRERKSLSDIAVEKTEGNCGNTTIDLLCFRVFVFLSFLLKRRANNTTLSFRNVACGRDVRENCQELPRYSRNVVVRVECVSSKISRVTRNIEPSLVGVFM